MQIWMVLAALTLARAAMAFQFQQVPALAAPMMTETGLGFGAIGVLAGVYFLPGAVTALLGGWAGQVLGDIRTTLGGLALMVAGGLAGAWAAGFELQVAARFVAGTGAVAVNVMVTKMVGDWFQGRRDMPLAMGILVSSWPIGLALAMLVLPPLVPVLGLAHTAALPAWGALLAFGFLWLTWAAPPRAATAPAPSDRPGLTGAELRLVVLAGAIWGLYNVAFIATISYAPGRLQAAGLAPLEASGLGSVIGWVAVATVAGGGWLAARLARPDAAALGSFALSALALLAFTLGGASMTGLPVLIALGLALGPAAAMIMTLPVEATRREVRAFAMGLYMAIYYLAMGVAPSLMGALRDGTGAASAPLLAAAGIMAVCLLLWAGFRRLQAMR